MQINLRVSLSGTLKYICNVISVVDEKHLPVAVKLCCGDVVLHDHSMQRLPLRSHLLLAKTRLADCSILRE